MSAILINCEIPKLLWNIYLYQLSYCQVHIGASVSAEWMNVCGVSVSAEWMNVYMHRLTQFSSVQSLSHVWPHESQHARPPCPSPTPGVHSNPCPSSRWCIRAISSSVTPFSACPQSLPASESFPMSQLFPWGGQSTGVSASAPVLPMNTQDDLL